VSPYRFSGEPLTELEIQLIIGRRLFPAVIEVIEVLANESSIFKFQPMRAVNLNIPANDNLLKSFNHLLLKLSYQ
jgi:hypothetical protein